MSGAAGDGGVRVDVACGTRVNWAMQRNEVPLMRRFRLENAGEEPLKGVTVRIYSVPPFTATWEREVEAIPPGEACSFEPVDLFLDANRLANQPRREPGSLRLSVAAGERTVLERTFPLEILARDEWAGTASVPELLAAHVLPRHPALDPVLRRASAILAEGTRSGALDGYRSRDPARPRAIVEAIWEAIGEHRIATVLPPEGFEESGLTVRTPDRILVDGAGTCIDLAALAASAFEHAGLHPILTVARGHAAVGAWLVDDSFPEASVVDPVAVRKRADSGRILLLEATFLTDEGKPSFSASAAEGRRLLDDAGRFLFAVDVRAARAARILPLPAKSEAGLDALEEHRTETVTVADSVPDLVAEGVLQARAGRRFETPTVRLERWKRRLLDLSLRNRLLHCRDTRTVLPLLCDDVAGLEDALQEGKAFALRGTADPGGPAGPADPAAEAREGRLLSPLPAAEADRRLLEIHRAARNSLEESGANTLYLALGFLEWTETPASPDVRRAPLVLVPVVLERASVRSGYVLRMAEEDARVNRTLLQKLQDDLGVALAFPEAPPEDAAGLDVRAILDVFRRAVAGVPRWAVKEEIALGLFSFAKFLMWHDLDRRAEDLLASPLARHLVENPRLPFERKAKFPDPALLDDERRSADALCPVDADSSQLAAVFAAADGRTFVLEGPPGTGKSQTITNIVARTLAEGRRVLFVAEKQAALDVVRERLRAAGLGPFCLELHSNRVAKRRVVEQLQEALGAAGAKEPSEWEERAARLDALRKGLNEVARALHLRRDHGESVFEATSRLVALRGAPLVELGPGLPAHPSWDDVELLRDAARRLAATGEAAGALADHPWKGVRRGAWEPSAGTEAGRRARGLAEAAAAFREALRDGEADLPGSPAEGSAEALELFHQGANLLRESPGPPAVLLRDPDWEAVRAALGGWIEKGRRRDGLRKGILASWDRSLLALDLDAVRGDLAAAERAGFPLSWFKAFGAKRALRRAARGGRLPPPDRLRQDLEAAAELRDLEAALGDPGGEAARLLGPHWRGGDVDWARADAMAAWCGRFREFLAAYAPPGPPGDPAREAWIAIAAGGSAAAGQVAARLKRSAAFREARAGIVAFLDADEHAVWGGPAEPGHLARVEEVARRWAAFEGRLRDWCAWQRARRDAAARGLAPLVEAAETGAVAAARLLPALERSFREWWIAKVGREEPCLADFSSADVEARIREFRDHDRRVTEVAREVVKARLAARVPRADADGEAAEEVGLLLREARKQRRHLPVRRLLARIPRLVRLLKPCLLMSPLSVAQYLDPSFPAADLVVFDEASQIPVWDAVGALARGRQAVVVGDSRQLPPTTFFEKSAEDAEAGEEADVEEVESVLEECVASRVHALTLDWHYRSRHESLIAFSNRNYYGDRLQTFPSPDSAGGRLGVSLVRVDGVYDRGGTCTNRIEAEAVVAETLRRLRDPAEGGRSIGIVTFSRAQQVLVEDLIEAARAADPDVDAALAGAVAEPLFVKNLENVQGDERDVILFSVCYGRDADGAMTMNFGPLNREGGERRLNVAVTRAREQVVVFASVGADAVDLTRTRARGVEDLRVFLDYAARGAVALAAPAAPGGPALPEGPLEEAVRAALVAKGWEVDRRVGRSGYRIDLAVRDPARPGRWLLGIQCDGDSWASARTARERERLRGEVLERLGWSLARVWSADWWHDPERVLEGLDRRLRKEAGQEGRP